LERECLLFKFSFSNKSPTGRSMRKGMLFCGVSALLFFPLSVRAQRSSDSGTTVAGSHASGSFDSTGPLSESGQPGDSISSASVSRKFYEIAYELAKPSPVRGPELEQAITFLTAALTLDTNAKGIRPLLIELASRDSTRDTSSLVREMLVDYVDEFADLEVVRKGRSATCSRRANSREERERLLEQLRGRAWAAKTTSSALRLRPCSVF